MTDKEPGAAAHIRRVEEKQKAAVSRIEQLAERRLAKGKGQGKDAAPVMGGLTPAGVALVESKRKFEVEDAHLLPDQAVQWVVRGLLESDSLACLSGEPGAGKSFMALSWCFHIAAGLDWCGQRVKPGAVLYICGEGRRGIRRRLHALSIETGVPIDEKLLLSVSKTAANLTSETGVDEVLSVVAEVVKRRGPLSLICVDTLSRNFGAGDENSTADMQLFVAMLDRLREATGATVAVIHHVGRGDKGRGRGSSVLPAAVDTDMLLTVDAARTLHMESLKVKDGEAFKPMAFRLESVDLGQVDEDGDPVTSAVIRQVVDAGSVVKNASARGKNQVTALSVLKQQFAEQRAYIEASSKPVSKVLVTVEEWKERCKALGMDRRRLFDAKGKLEKSGAIRIEGENVFLNGESAFDDD